MAQKCQRIWIILPTVARVVFFFPHLLIPNAVDWFITMWIFKWHFIINDTQSLNSPLRIFFLPYLLLLAGCLSHCRMVISLTIPPVLFFFPALFCLTLKSSEWSYSCQGLRHTALRPYHLWHAHLSGWEMLSTPVFGWWFIQVGIGTSNVNMA